MYICKYLRKFLKISLPPLAKVENEIKAFNENRDKLALGALKSSLSKILR